MASISIIVKHDYNDDDDGNEENNLQLLMEEKEEVDFFLSKNVLD